jgi:DDE superfamily endonuclease
MMQEVCRWLPGRRSHQTERPIHRPTAPEDQQDYDSGKKKGHTSKNPLIIDESCHSCFLSDTVEYKEHDKSLADVAGFTLSCGSHLDPNMGFQGFMLDGITIIHPKKKPCGGELTPPQKAHIRVISSVRIRIEHATGGVKRDGMAKDKRRPLKAGIHDTFMETSCGRQNFRLQYRPWNYAR